MNLKDKIFANDKLIVEAVEVPEWDVTVYVRTISGTERDAFEAASLVKKGKTRETNLQNLRARMVVLCSCNEDGTPVFHPNEVDRVGALNARALDRVFTVAQRLNGWSEGDVEEMAKN